MKTAEFHSYYNHSYYNEDGKTKESFGSLVADLAYQIIPDIDASELIRQEVMEIGSKRCERFKESTAWDGDKALQWSGLKEVTRECCKEMILLPKPENPLAKGNLRQYADDPWSLSIAALSFEERQVFLLGMSFTRSVRSIRPLLNANKEEKKNEKAIKNLQAEALNKFIEHLIGFYRPE